MSKISEDSTDIYLSTPSHRPIVVYTKIGYIYDRMQKIRPVHDK